MRHGNYDPEESTAFNWRVVSHLLPFLWESRQRVLLALGCMVLAKAAVILIPFLLKYIVDALEQSGAEAMPVLALAGLLGWYALKLRKINSS